MTGVPPDVLVEIGMGIFDTDELEREQAGNFQKHVSHYYIW